MPSVDPALVEAIKAAVAEAVTEALERTGERAWTVEEAMERLGGLSRATFYQMVGDGRIRLRKAGSRSLVLQSEITRFLRGLPAQEGER